MVIATLLLAATFTRPMERVSTMDPAMATSVYDSQAVHLVYEPPLEIDYAARPYKLVPGFCELPEVSEDGLVYTFKVKSQCATAANAYDSADVVCSLERLRDSQVVSPNGWILKDVDSIRAIDDRRVEIRLRRRCHFFPWLMAMSACGIRLRDGEGTGPYRLAHWRKNHEMVFTRRPQQSIDRPIDESNGFDVVRYLVVDDVSTQWLMFLKGELDFLGGISRDIWDSVVGPDGRLVPELAAKGVALHSVPTLEAMYVGINMRDPVLGPNRKLRQALNAAFDYPAWDRFYHGSILPSDGPVPLGVDGRLDSPFPYRFDLAKARRLLAEAGYPDGIDPETGRRLTLTMSIGRANQESREAGELMAAFYARIGIRLELQYMTWSAFLKAVDEGRVQLYRMGWVGDYPDAQNFLQLFHSSNSSPGPNHSHYMNADFDREFDAAMAAPTVEARNVHWRTCQEIVREDCPWIFTHFTKAYSLVRSHVGNYIPSDFPYGHERHYTVSGRK